ncbi:MAG: molybdenum cofactor cytidylyltransferase [Polaribacter sp.]|jgi:molybdenum cofactor cytidylyltransferase
MKNYSIILLAAGSSTRMGHPNKLLLLFRGTTLVEYCADKLIPLNPKELIVVTGFEAAKIQFRLFDRPFKFTYNSDYKTGMTSSIQQGVSVIDPTSKGVLICQSDMPELKIEDLQKVTAIIEANIDKKPQLIVAPHIGKRMGNPVFFSRSYFEGLLNHDEPNGCKSLINSNLAHLLKVELDNKDAFSDVDTPEDYQRY